MAGVAPHLTDTDLRAELERLHARDHRTLDTAFYGTGEPGSLAATVRGELQRFAVRPVDCELRLRQELSRPRSGEPVVLLVDFAELLPLDVQGRLAGGVVQHISRERRLANLFGARAVAPAL